MRVVFMGTPSFAVPSLRALAERHEVVGVYTRVDAASGRGRTLRPSPVKEAALELGLPVFQPKTLRESETQAQMKALAPDIVVVAAYGLILPPEVLGIPRFGCVNVHASLLPRWRGAAPIQRAILAGDEITGVSIMRMEEGLDTGPYCEVASTSVAEKDVEELTDELAVMGAKALLTALDTMMDGTCSWTEQDEHLVTYASKIGKDDVTLTPDLTVDEALRRTRASSPQAPARVLLSGRGATVVDAVSSDESLDAGSVACTKQALLIGFKDGALLAERVKPDGKNEMAGCDWARGARLGDAARWETAR